MRLSVKQQKALETFQRCLLSQRNDIVADFAVLQDRLTAAVQDFNEKIRAHNGELARAREFVTAVADELRAFVDEKSDRWKQSDAGQQVEAMAEAWENCQLEPVAEVTLLLPDRPAFEESLNLPIDQEDV